MIDYDHLDNYPDREDELFFVMFYEPETDFDGEGEAILSWFKSYNISYGFVEDTKVVVYSKEDHDLYRARWETTLFAIDHLAKIGFLTPNQAE